MNPFLLSKGAFSSFLLVLSCGLCILVLDQSKISGTDLLGMAIQEDSKTYRIDPEAYFHCQGSMRNCMDNLCKLTERPRIAMAALVPGTKDCLGPLWTLTPGKFMSLFSLFLSAQVLVLILFEMKWACKNSRALLFLARIPLLVYLVQVTGLPYRLSPEDLLAALLLVHPF